MQHRAFTLWQAALLLIVIGVLAAILMPVYTRINDNMNPRYCHNYLKQIGMGLRQYIQDYDGRYAPVSVGRNGWADIAQPYLTTYKLFQCPTAKDEETEVNSTDYFYNAQVAGKLEKQVLFPDRTIMCGDGLNNALTDTHISKLPLEWSVKATSPAQRHDGSAFYLFVDGHVTSFPPSKISGKSPRSSKATFAIK